MILYMMATLLAQVVWAQLQNSDSNFRNKEVLSRLKGGSGNPTGRGGQDEVQGNPVRPEGSPEGGPRKLSWVGVGPSVVT